MLGNTGLELYFWDHHLHYQQYCQYNPSAFVGVVREVQYYYGIFLVQK